MLRVLAALHDESAVDLFWDRLSADHPKDVRLIAIQAIGGFASPANEERMRLLMDCALERDFQLAAPALMVLQRLSVAPKHLPHWRRLLEAPDPATRKLAIEKLAGLNDAAVADALLAQVRHPDRQLRDAALSALQRTPRGRAALERGLLEAAGADEAWSLARAQVELAREWKPAQRRRIFDKLCAYHQADDRRADALFFLLRETNHDGTRDELAARAAELRKKKKFAEALALYKLLTRDPASGEMLRFDMAATGLKLSPKDLAPESRQADPCLGHFARLLQDRGFDLAGLVAKAKWLDADDLYYLGFHFVEHNHRERDFGAEVLRLVIRRRPNSSAAKDARRKLKSEGLTG